MAYHKALASISDPTRRSVLEKLRAGPPMSPERMRAQQRLMAYQMAEATSAVAGKMAR